MITKLSITTAVQWGDNAQTVFRGEGLPDTNRRKEEQKGKGYHMKKTSSPEDAMICLTCPRKHCAGEADCFRARKKELKGGG